MNHDRKRKKKETWICWFFSFLLFLPFLSFLPLIRSFSPKTHSLHPLLPHRSALLLASRTNEKVGHRGVEWHGGLNDRREWRSIDSFLPSFLSPNSRRPNSTLSSVRHIQPCRQWGGGGIHCGSTKKWSFQRHSRAGITTSDCFFRLFLVFFGWVSPFHLPRASTFLFVSKLRFQVAYYV